MQWEYLFVPVDQFGNYTKLSGEKEDHLDNLGFHGWELVTVFIIDGQPIAALKRPINIIFKEK